MEKPPRHNAEGCEYYDQKLLVLTKQQEGEACPDASKPGADDNLGKVQKEEMNKLEEWGYTIKCQTIDSYLDSTPNPSSSPIGCLLDNDFTCSQARMATCPCSALAYLVFVAEAGIGLWIWSVWSWRLRIVTSFRPVGAENMVQEFKTYGYPMWFFYLIFACKVSFASILVLAIILPDPILTLIGAGGMFALMSGALLSHLKVKDPVGRYIAASVMWVLSTYILIALSKSCVVHTPASDDLVRTCSGCVVALACFIMWLRSCLRGDYNFASYDELDEKKEGLLA